MSNTIKDKLKIEATNKLLLDNHKQKVINIIDEKLNTFTNPNLTQQEHTLKVFKYLLRGCDCNKATIDFIKKQIG